MSRQPRVLVTGADHTGTLAAVRALRRAGYAPWVAAPDRGAYAARSRAAAGVILLPDVRADRDGFLLGLRTAAADRFDVVLPGTERDLIAIAGERDRLGALAAGVPPLESVLRATSKSIVYQLAHDAGLLVPTTVGLAEAHRLGDDELSLPVVVKPVRSELSSPDGLLEHVDAEVIETRQELARLAESLPAGDYLVQSRVRGRLGAISGVAWQGEIVIAVHQRSLRIWPPQSGVSSYAYTVAPDPGLELQVADLIAALRWSGIFQIQFLFAPGGPYLIDLNPRVYGSLALATAAGANLPAIWVELVTGSPTPKPAYRVGVRYRSEELDLRALLALLLGGRPGAAFMGLMPRPHTTHSVLTLSDPLPVLRSLAKLRRVLRKALRTTRAA